MWVGGSERDLARKWELMTDIGRPAQETVGGATQADKILDIGEVVQAKPPSEEAGLDLDSAARLQECAGTSEAGRRRLGVDLADGRDGLVEIAAELRDATVELKREGDAVSIQREDGTRAGDGLSEPKGRLTRGRRVRAKAVKVQKVQRSSFRIDVKYWRNLDGRCLLLACRRAHDDADDIMRLRQLVSGEIGTSTPGAVGGGDGVGVGNKPPFVLEVLVLHQCKTGRKAILRGEAAERDVQGLTEHQSLADAAQMSQSEGGTGLDKLLSAGMELQPLAAKFGLDAAFVAGLVTDLITALRQRDMRDEECGQQCDRAPLHFFPASFARSAAWPQLSLRLSLQLTFSAGAGVFAAVAATASPQLSCVASLQAWGRRRRRGLQAAGASVPRSALVTAAM